MFDGKRGKVVHVLSMIKQVEKDGSKMDLEVQLCAVDGDHRRFQA